MKSSERHTPDKTIKGVFNGGHLPSIRTTLKLGFRLSLKLSSKRIDTVCELVPLKKEDLRKILLPDPDLEHDIVLIEGALNGVGLHLGMTQEELRGYKTS